MHKRMNINDLLRLYGNVWDLISPEATCINTKVVGMPGEVMMFIAGFECDNYSNCNIDSAEVVVDASKLNGQTYISLTH